MNDLDTIDPHPLDDRARRAGAALRSSASQRALPELHVQRDRRGWGSLVAVACVALLVVGLVGIARRAAPDPAANHNDNLHWLIGDLPDSFEPSELLVPDASVITPVDSTVYSVFGTDLAPDGPQFSIHVPNPQFFSQPLDAFGAVNFVERDEGGQRLVFADLSSPVGSQQPETDVRLMFVEIDERWTQTTSRGITDAELSRIAGAMTLDRADAADVAVDALPVGVRLLDAGPAAQIAPVFFVSAGGAVPTGVVRVTYLGPNAFEFVQLTVGRTTPADLSNAALSYNGFTATSLNSQPAWFIDGKDGATTSTLVWQRDQLTFYLAQTFATEAELLATAGTVRPASDGEWDELISTTPGRMIEETATTEPVDTDIIESADTIDNNDASSRPDPSIDSPERPAGSDIVVSVETNNATASEVRLSASLPDGYSYAVDVAVLDDGIRLAPLIDNTQLGTYTYPRPLADTMTFTAVISSDDDSQPGTSGIIAMTEDPVATQLRVTRTNGERYIADLAVVANHPGVKFAAILMPPRELASADLIDADGSIVATWTP